MNKKGFTLVELLTTLAILSIVTGIAVIAYTSIVTNSKLRVFKTYEKTMHSEAMALLVKAATDPSKASLFPRNGETIRFSLDDLGIDPIKNPRNSNDLCLTSYVDVTRNDYYNTTTKTYVDAFEYKVCLICTESDYNVTGESCMLYPEPTDSLETPPEEEPEEPEGDDFE